MYTSPPWTSRNRVAKRGQKGATWITGRDLIGRPWRGRVCESPVVWKTQIVGPARGGGMISHPALKHYQCWEMRGKKKKKSNANTVCAVQSVVWREPPHHHPRIPHETKHHVSVALWCFLSETCGRCVTGLAVKGAEPVALRCTSH